MQALRVCNVSHSYPSVTMGFINPAPPRADLLGAFASTTCPDRSALGTRICVLGLAGALALHSGPTRAFAVKSVAATRAVTMGHFDGDRGLHPRAASQHDLGVAVTIALLLTAARHVIILVALRPAAARLSVKSPRQQQRFAELGWQGPSRRPRRLR